MKYQVIAAFIDKRTGEQVEPGSPVPEGLDRKTIDRLVNALCLEPVEGDAPEEETSGEGVDQQKGESGEGAEGGRTGEEDEDGSSSSPFPGEGAGAGGSADPGRTEPGTGSRPARKGRSQG